MSKKKISNVSSHEADARLTAMEFIKLKAEGRGLSLTPPSFCTLLGHLRPLLLLLFDLARPLLRNALSLSPFSPLSEQRVHKHVIITQVVGRSSAQCMRHKSALRWMHECPEFKWDEMCRTVNTFHETVLNISQ